MDGAVRSLEYRGSRERPENTIRRSSVWFSRQRVLSRPLDKPALIKAITIYHLSKNPGTTGTRLCDIVWCTACNKPSGCIWPAMIIARVETIA